MQNPLFNLLMWGLLRLAPNIIPVSEDNDFILIKTMPLSKSFQLWRWSHKQNLDIVCVCVCVCVCVEGESGDETKFCAANLLEVESLRVQSFAPS